MVTNHDPTTSVRATFASPLGPIDVFAVGGQLVGLWFADRTPAHLTATRHATGDIVDQTRDWLDAYFAGRATPEPPPVHLSGTAFQRAVWSCLTDIDYGTTWSYGQLASAIGRPTAVRAVGRAVGSNPVSIIVPCHRVVGADGSLTGYGGGLDRKRHLLALEQT